MPTLDFAGPRTTPLRHTRGLLVIQLHDSLWRVTLEAGDVVGYVERFETVAGSRYRAKRFLPRQRRFLIDGEFWEMSDALACFQ